MGACQLERQGSPYVCQHRDGDILSIVVPWHDSRGWSMSSCLLMDPLVTQAVHRPWLFLGCGGEDVISEFSR
jgi:hypothetical protein